MARNRNNRNFKRKAKKTYSIIVDGKTEVWYLQMLKKNESLPRIDIKPELPKKKSVVEQIAAVKENSNIYDKVIWIVDFDTIIKETKESKGGTKTALEEFTHFKNSVNKESNNIEILINTPCLEFWILLHFTNTGRTFSDCNSAENELKKHFKSYQKTERFFKSKSIDIYKSLNDKKELAIKNAKLLGDFDIENPQKSIAEIHNIFERFNITK